MRPNVLLVILDSVRARNMSLYGHSNETTPFLESFAEEATVYTQARAPGTWSLPSHVSMFTGLSVSEHNVTFRGHRLVEGATLWDDLRQNHGYVTAVFSANPFLTEVPLGLKRSFDTVVGRVDLPFPDATDPREFVREEGRGRFIRYVEHCLDADRTFASLINGLYEKLDRDAPVMIPDAVRPRVSGKLYLDRFLDWEHHRSGPWAACVNLMDAHHPYEPQKEHDQWGKRRLRELQEDIESPMWEFNCGHRPWWQRKALEALYDGCIRQTDAHLEYLLGELKRRGALEDTFLVVTSDHGEGFGEPAHVRPGARAVGHGNGGIHEVLLHVPLVVSYPEQESPGWVEGICSLTTIPAAVNEVLEGNWSVGTGFVTDDAVLASTSGLNERMCKNARRYCDDLYLFDGPAQAVYRRGDGSVRKYVTWRSQSATIEVRDAQTSYKLSTDGSDVVDRAFATVEDAGVRIEESPDVDPSVQRRLERLGYG